MTDQTDHGLLRADPDRDSVFVKELRTGAVQQATVDDDGIVRTDDQTGAAFADGPYELRFYDELQAHE